VHSEDKDIHRRLPSNKTVDAIRFLLLDGKTCA